MIEKSIDILTRSFQKYPDNYFSECELQYELYLIIKSSQEFNRSFKTIDEKNVKIVHPEYPSVSRIQLNKGKGYRVWFDLAILNPNFIENNSYKTILAKNEYDAKLFGYNLLAAFEFKFFNKKRNTDISYVMEDCRKLSLCSEIADKYVLAFSGYEPDLSALQNIDLDNTRLYWITPHTVNKLS